MLHTVFIIILYRTLSWCQRVVRISRNRENLTAIELHNKIQEGIYSDQTPQQQRQHTQHFKRLLKSTLNIQTSSETICCDHSILEM